MRARAAAFAAAAALCGRRAEGQDPATCLSECSAVGKNGCCMTGQAGCMWWPDGWVTDGGASGDAGANCHDGTGCDGWNWGRKCDGRNGSEPVPKPGPTPPPVPTPIPPKPPAQPTNPTGDGTIAVNLFSSSTPWTDTSGQRVQAHSGMLFEDQKDGGWVFIGNSDVDPSQVGGGENGQISFYRAPELYGPWGTEQVLITVDQANKLPGMNASWGVGILERPKVHQQGGYYYLFLHIEPHGKYNLEMLGLWRFKSLAAPSDANPWENVFVGRPGLNKQTGQGFHVLDFGIFSDTVTGKVLYTATTDSYRFPGQCCEGDPPGLCNYTTTAFCANTALVTFDVDVEKGTFTPVGTLPGRWEAPTLFRDPGDSSTLWMMCSGQDGFGPNPVGLFSAKLGSSGVAEARDDQGDYPWPAPLIWTCHGLPHSGSGNAFNTQPFQVLPNPYSSAHGIYFGDNWLHGPGKQTTGSCADPGWHGMDNCEPWQGNCPCNYPNNKCPGTSSPGFTAGYVWLPFTWKKLQSDPKYLVCAHSSWNMKSPPGDDATCYTFNVFPDTPFTPGLVDETDYRGQHTPYIESSCGFIECPGWPKTAKANSENTTACCEAVGDAITQSRNGGRCRADDLCMGACKEDEHSNIPGGHGGCTFSAFDPSKAKMVGSDGKDCTAVRGESGHGTVDPCRGSHNVPA